MNASLKFNAYSELTFTIGRTYTNMITGETQVNPFYNKIEALRLVYLEGFGYFEIQDPEIVSDGIKEVKNVTAYSLEYTLSQKYLEDFYINTGEINSREVIYANDNGLSISPIVFYNDAEPGLSLVNLILEKVYGWTIGHVDSSLIDTGRMFEVSRESVYDFIVNDICEKFNCFAVFDTIDNTINFYAEALISKHIGDGIATSFVVSPPYATLGSVSIDGYKTTAYVYNSATGELVFDHPPGNGAKIEIEDGSQENWTTDVYVTFDNLAQEINVSYSADDIKTVLTVKGADDLDIRDVNMGLPYIVDLSYYYTVDWMGQELYDAYTKYLQTCNDDQEIYKSNATEMLEWYDRISYEQGRVSLQYSVADNVTSTTVGTYYIRGGSYPNYYYTEVKLPDNWTANTTYYMESGSDLDEDKFRNLYYALSAYLKSQDDKDVSELEKLKDSFAFMDTYTIEQFISNLSGVTTEEQQNVVIEEFYDELLNQLGLFILNNYKATYVNINQGLAKEQGYDDPTNENYWRYSLSTLIVSVLQSEIQERETTINSYKDQYNLLQSQNQEITNNVLLDVFFAKYLEEQGFDEQTVRLKTQELLVRISAFLREDEYTDDNFVKTDSDSYDTIIQTQQELMECGRIELSKLCEPKLEFSMDMANIYALPEFEPIIDQFQLGNLINVEIRSDYVKRARLLAVDINFDDFSDFSCEFGELTNLRTPSSIHADLLSNALTAGKSVASNASYWNQGANTATDLRLLIQQGLLDAATTIKAIDANQNVTIDRTGIHLQKIDQSTGEIDPKQGWIVNNQFLYSDDNFKTTKSVFGEYTVDGQNKWGLLAEAVMAGYLAGCVIEGGTINIGEGTFVVDANGAVTMKASSIDGYVEEDNVISSINQSAEQIAINANKVSLAGKNIDLTSDNITISSTNFSVTKDGHITATSGEIAGWTIHPGLLRKEITVNNVDYQMYLQASDGVNTTNAFAVRKRSSGAASWDTQFAVNYLGKLTAKNANITGTITAEGGSIAGYNIGSGGSYNNSIYKRVTGSSTDYEVGLKATSGTTDLAFYVKESTDNWESSINNFYIRNNGQLYAKSADITGTINATAGNIGGCSIANGVLNVDAANITSGTIATARIPNLNADKITAGVINADRIPNINADKITVGTLNADRIPNISASKITSGTIDASVVTVKNLSASNITSGSISTSRLDSSVITTGNFSSKTLSTANLTMAGGCRLGVASEYNAKLYSTGGYTWMEAFTPNSSYLSSVMNIVRAGVNVASTRDIKHEIHDFDDRYDVFFDKLNPQLFKYNFESDMGYSMGFIWEEAKESMNECGLSENDLGAIHESAGTIGGKVFRKDDFVALNTWQIQKLKNKVEELERKLSALEA